MTPLHNEDFRKAYSLIELLVVVGIVAILAGLLLSAVSRANLKASRGVCISNQKQIATALLFYAESDGKFPTTNQTTIKFPFLISRFIGSNSSVYRCPADKFVINNPGERWEKGSFELIGTSYGFNGRNGLGFTNAEDFNGLDGFPLTSVFRPELTVLTFDAPAVRGYSWHKPEKKSDYYNDSLNVLSFVDGHVEYSKIFWTNTAASFSEPPLGYGYKWRAN